MREPRSSQTHDDQLSARQRMAAAGIGSLITSMLVTPLDGLGC
ncbi:MAG TPA: hypothetical protein V6C97_06190 [Oculatellaceae cyanobacterium]